MRWKDRLAGGRLGECKDRGEWAELYFMMQAAGRGMRVLKPFGSTGPYDVGVDNQMSVLRVQVKSTIYRRREEEYSLNVMGPQRQMYAPGTVDFFAVLLIPEDEWYIIPYHVLGEKNCTLHLRPKGGKQLYRKYREAWNLLESAGLTIQACADPAYEEADGGSEMGLAEGDSGGLLEEGKKIDIGAVAEERRGLRGLWDRLLGR